MSVQADYVWNAARREQSNQNTNLLFDPVTGNNLPFFLAGGAPGPRPFPNNLGITLQARAAGKSNYHGLETGFTKRMSQNWQSSVTYTLSKFDDYIPPPLSGGTLVTFKVPEDLGDSWYPTIGDQRHRAVFTSVWNLPHDFQLSGLYFYGSGQAFGSNYGADLRNSGNLSFLLRPDQTIVARNRKGLLTKKEGT